MTCRTLIVAVISERVTVHDHLDGIVSWEHIEREATIILRFHEVALGIVNLLAVHHEVGTLHRDTRTVVHHITRETFTVLDDNLAQRLVVAMGIERHTGTLR